MVNNSTIISYSQDYTFSEMIEKIVDLEERIEEYEEIVEDLKSDLLEANCEIDRLEMEAEE